MVVRSLFLAMAVVTSAQADMSFEIINRMVIDCNRAQEQYEFLESEKSTTGDKFKSSIMNNTLLGSLYAKATGQSKWAYTTRSGTRDAVIKLKQQQIREYCWNPIPLGY